MHAALALQYLVIALAVMASAWVALHKVFPGTARRARIACAAPLLRADRPRWLHAVARRLAPPSADAAASCGGCTSCETPR